MTVRVAVVGAGYWGQNHVRAFAALPGASLAMVCDADAAAQARARFIAPHAQVVSRFEEVLSSSSVDAVVLATPAALHATQAQAVLKAGKHLFVEKPLALSLADAERVADVARASGRFCMVGHLMIHHPAVAKLKELVDGGTIGDVHYVYSSRVNLGRLRSDENALWSFGPHDVSIILHLLGRMPIAVAARGHAYLQAGVEDVVFLHLDFAGGQMAHVQMSWLDPRKERRMTIVGSRRMVELDDVQPTEKLRIYDRGYDRPPEFANFAQYLTVRHGDVHIPQLAMTEPLLVECAHFVQSIATGTEPRPTVTDGVAVVRVLAAAQRSLETGGVAVSV